MVRPQELQEGAAHGERCVALRGAAREAGRIGARGRAGGGGPWGPKRQRFVRRRRGRGSQATRMCCGGERNQLQCAGRLCMGHASGPGGAAMDVRGWRRPRGAGQARGECRGRWWSGAGRRGCVGPGGYTRGAQVGERSGWVHRALALSLGQVALGWGARRRGSWGGSATHLSLQGGQRGAGERAGRGRSMFSVVGRRRGRARGAGRGAVGFRPGRA